MKESYSIYDAKAHLSRLLRKVKDGGEVIISERGTPIARVVPYSAPKDFEEGIQEKIRSGIILAPRAHSFPQGRKKVGALKRFLEERE